MNTIDFLKANEHKSADGFLSQAAYVRDNWIWLKYSYAIAIKVRRRMQELHLTQKQLADSLGCTQQHVSILLKGKVNMTLETLAKLEQALDIDIIGSSLQGFIYPEAASSQVGYLNDSAGEEMTGRLKTSELVDGYKPRKKKGPRGAK
jgi:transcriptional regulator with XRE-family HTH domain